MSQPEDPIDPTKWKKQMDGMEAQFRQNEIIISLLRGLQGIPNLLVGVNEKLNLLVNAPRPSANDTLLNLEALADDQSTNPKRTAEHSDTETAVLPPPTSSAPIVTPERWYYQNNLLRSAETRRKSNHPDWNRQLKVPTNSFVIISLNEGMN